LIEEAYLGEGDWRERMRSELKVSVLLLSWLLRCCLCLQSTIKSRRLLHVICPFSIGGNVGVDSSLLGDTQMIVLETLRQAKQKAESHPLGNEFSINIIAILYKEDQFLPLGDEFTISKHFLTNSSQYFAPNSNKLPLLKDILQIAMLEAEQRQSTHMIFTNMDINVMPTFYLQVHSMLEHIPAFFINR
jgi:hypothetical protein